MLFLQVSSVLRSVHLFNLVQQHNVIMPWWAEPWRHMVVVMFVCLYVFRLHFSAMAKN